MVVPNAEKPSYALDAVETAITLSMTAVCAVEAAAPQRVDVGVIPLMGPIIERFPVASAIFFGGAAVLAGASMGVKAIRQRHHTSANDASL